jgi:hypothetical protein
MFSRNFEENYFIRFKIIINRVEFDCDGVE